MTSSDAPAQVTPPPVSEDWKAAAAREVARQCPALLLFLVLAVVFLRSAERASDRQLVQQQAQTRAAQDLSVAMSDLRGVIQSAQLCRCP